MTTATRSRKFASISERLEHHSDRSAGPDGCWLWTASLGTVGYGNLWFKGRCMSAHRVAYELASGPIPIGMAVMHSCDVRACVNPAHLSVGTNRENCIDRERKGRGRWSKPGKA